MKRVCILLLFFAGILCMTGGIFPFHDDWSYLTAPNPDFNFGMLLPDAAFWRPFDALWGGLLAKCPSAFPLANRVVISIAHVLNSLMVWNVLFSLRRDCIAQGECSFSYQTVLGTVFFAVSSAMAATLVNTDTINQTWSFFCGIVSLYVALAGDLCGRRLAIVGSLLLLSILFKESGVSWMVSIPVILWWKDSGIKRAWRYGALFSVLLLFYFVMRFVLQGKVVLGDGQYYALAFNPESVLGNILMSVFVPLSGIDGLAFVCNKFGLLSLTVVLSLIFWALFARVAEWRDAGRTFSAAIAIAIAMSLPHCFFKGHHPAEMHFYPVVFAGSFLLGTLHQKSCDVILKVGLISAMLSLFAVGWYDKMSETYWRSARTRRLYENLRTRDIDFSRPVYFIVEMDQSVNYYSVFAGSAAHGIEFGKACRSFNGWKEFDWHMAYTFEQIARIPVSAQTVRIK